MWLYSTIRPGLRAAVEDPLEMLRKHFAAKQDSVED